MSSTQEGRSPAFDRQVVLDQLGGWRGMIDVSLPTIAFILANNLGGLTVGIWAALGTAVLVFALRLVRRETVQQAISGLIGVAVAVAIARVSGEARDFFVPGLIRNAVLALVLLGSILVRWPLIGVAAEFLAPSHLGSMAGHDLRASLGRGKLSRRLRDGAAAALPTDTTRDATRDAIGDTTRDDTTGSDTDGGPGAAGEPAPEAAAERHWRTDRRMLRAYSWLTLLWAMTFVVRFAVTGLLYWQDQVELLGTASLVLGLPVTALVLVVTLWVVARLHRHRTPA